MREIKFRGKGSDGKWHFSDEYKPDLPAYSLCSFWGRVDNFNAPTECLLEDAIDPSTVGQWTGLKDKNGVDIYEGDRIDGQSDGITYVEWQDDSWILVFEGETSSCIPLSELTSWGSNEATVIGNIHEVTK